MADTADITKKNEELEVSLHKDKNCEIRLEVKATAPLVKIARKKAIKEVAKEVEVPGFRKGKAPEALIIKKHGPQLEEQWHREIAREVFAALQKLIDIPPLSMHSKVNFNLIKHSLEEGAELTYNFETEPTVPAIDPTQFQLKEIKKAEVGQKEIDEAIRQIRFFQAKWKEITDRPIQENDYIILDLESLDTDPAQKVFSNTRFEVSEKGMATWMKKLVLGAKLNDVLEGVSEPDENASSEEKEKFEKKKVRVTIHKIEEADLPEVNDEFAKTMGTENVEKLQESIKKMLEQQAEDKVDQDKREQVNRFFFSHAFDLPLSLIAAEKKHRLEQYLKDSRFQAEWQKAPKEEKEGFEKNIEQEAMNSIRLFYITKHIIDEKKIPITNEEIDAMALAMKPHYNNDPQNLTNDDKSQAVARLFVLKAQDYILENAKKKEEEKS